jgi:hypothetical protein
VVDALPRSLTRLEHSLILRELVPSQISLDALLEKRSFVPGLVQKSL